MHALSTPAKAFCPHCNKPNDDLEAPSGDPLDLEGCVFVCDHCGRRFVVSGVRPTVILDLRRA
jgi:hypothetical protein